MRRSETIAPGAPSALRTAPLVTCVRLGSETDHETMLAHTAARTSKQQKPASRVPAHRSGVLRERPAEGVDDEALDEDGMVANVSYADT